jgi:hypothetical protein
LIEEVMKGGSPGCQVQVTDEDYGGRRLAGLSGCCGIDQLAGAELEAGLADGWHAVDCDEVQRSFRGLHVGGDCRDPGVLVVVGGDAEMADACIVKR